MAKARALDKRRKSVKNIRKITRTMELIATARFKKAMDRAHAATAYTKRMTALVADLANSGLTVSHPLLDARPETKTVALLVLTGNRGLCGGYNSNVQRAGLARYQELKASIPNVRLEVSGKRGISAFKFRGATPDVSYTQFEDKPTFEEIDALASQYLEEFITRKIDRLDVVYTQFTNIARQQAVVETLLPLGSLTGADSGGESHSSRMYEFMPSAESILEEVVPTSFKIKLFKCFLDAAVSEQIARMVAMKAATENADKLIKRLAMQYNRARQSQITSEIMEVLGGVEALKG
ncbi:MAG: ATP synthase F1 subunit gamma [Planctomycetes bacterium]|nr:ATP synthase F1 subunit gamma [Planctomycetota bacterium]